MASDRFRRDLISSERIWLAMEKDWLPMNYAFIIDGTGSIDIEKVRESLVKLMKVYPIIGSKICGTSKKLYWEQADIVPPCIDLGHVDFGEWPTETEKRIYTEHLDLFNEPPVKVYLLSGRESKRLYFKVHHVAMDGIGCRMVIEDFFRIMNGQAPIGPSEGPETRYELYDKTLEPDFFEKRRKAIDEMMKSNPKDPEKMKGSFLVGGAYVGEHMISRPGSYNQLNWVSMLISKEKLPHAKLNGRLMQLLSDTLLEIRPEMRNRRFIAIVPVDIRYLMPGLRKASNLTGVVGVELDRYFGLPVAERSAAITQDIREKISKGFALSKHPPIADKLPTSLIGMIVSVFNRVQFMRNKSPYYFYFSNIGQYSLELFSAPGFKADRVIGLPILQPYCPFFALFSTHDNGTDLILMTDADKEGLQKVADTFKRKLES